MPQQRYGVQRRRAVALPDAEHAQIERLIARLHVLRGKFDQLHRRAKAALKAKDYQTFGKAIVSERALIAEHRKLIEQQHALIQRRMRPWRQVRLQ